MTKPNKVKEYRENQYPKQRIRFYIKKLNEIAENCEPEKIAEAILLLKNANIEDVELINQAIERVGK